jgi:hypothetical protein
VTTGFLGMNLLAWADQSALWRVVAFMVVLVPTAILTIMTVSKSRRLSEWLDALADDTLTTGAKFNAFWRVWFGSKKE